jgi:hypothetical protein
MKARKTGTPLASARLWPALHLARATGKAPRALPEGWDLSAQSKRRHLAVTEANKRKYLVVREGSSTSAQRF